MTVAILHDRLCAPGGSERVAIDLARTLDAPIYAGSADDAFVPDDVTVHQVFDGVGAACVRQGGLPAEVYQAGAWQSQPHLHTYDTVVINKSACAWYQPPARQRVVRYVHSTPRHLYDQLARSGCGWLGGMIAAAQRALNWPNRAHADAWLCNSPLVQRRLETYWGIDPAQITVAPPGVRGRDPADNREAYYVAIGRWDGSKGGRRILRAARDCPGTHLVMAGPGSRQRAFRRLADEETALLGTIDEAAKWRRYGGARATIFAGHNEDYGLVPVESLACGTPVIGVREGFTQHQIRDGRNGLLFDREDGALVQAIQRFAREGVAWSHDEIREDAVARFGRDQFRERVRAAVETDAPVIEPREPVVADGGSA